MNSCCETCPYNDTCPDAYTGIAPYCAENKALK